MKLMEYSKVGGTMTVLGTGSPSKRMSYTTLHIAKVCRWKDTEGSVPWLCQLTFSDLRCEGLP